MGRWNHGGHAATVGKSGKKSPTPATSSKAQTGNNISHFSHTCPSSPQNSVCASLARANQKHNGQGAWAMQLMGEGKGIDMIANWQWLASPSSNCSTPIKKTIQLKPISNLTEILLPPSFMRMILCHPCSCFLLLWFTRRYYSVWTYGIGFQRKLFNGPGKPPTKFSRTRIQHASR